jgi:hypothetical protein
MKFCNKEKGCLEPNQSQLFNMENQNYLYFQKDQIKSILGESLSYIYNKWTHPLQIGTHREGRPCGFS